MIDYDDTSDDLSIEIGFSDEEMDDLFAKMQDTHMRKIQLLEDKIKQLSNSKFDRVNNLYNSVDEDRLHESVFEVGEENIESMSENELENFIQLMHQEKQIKVKSKEDILQELEEEIIKNGEEWGADQVCEPYSSYEPILLKGSELVNIKELISDGTIYDMRITAGPNYTKMDNIFLIGFFSKTQFDIINLDFEATKDVLKELYMLLHDK